jgi:hypothetical protein
LEAWLLQSELAVQEAPHNCPPELDELLLDEALLELLELEPPLDEEDDDPLQAQ